MKIEFPSADNTMLAAQLDMPDGTPSAFALFAHCFTCSKESFAASRISRALVDHGIAVLRFDFTGLGGSDGDFANTNFTSNIDDVVAATEYLRDNYRAPTLLIGHSLGGAAILAAAHRVPSARALVTIGSPSDPAHISNLFADANDEIVNEGEATVQLGGRSFRIRKQLLDDIAAQPQAARLRDLSAALLVVHSPIDQTVGIDNAREIFEAAMHPKSFVALDGADHLLSDRKDAAFAANIIAAWSARYAFEDLSTEATAHTGATTPAPAPVTTPASTPPTSSAQASETSAVAITQDGTSVIVRESGPARYEQRVFASGHEFVSDEPAPLSENHGPGPYDFILAGLGSCTSITIRMYADRKKMPLTGVSVRLTRERIDAADCDHCASTEGMVEHITRELTFAGQLSDEQRDSLLVIADKCPVHRSLEGEISISTSVAS
ncbi:bifunctional alpha/beta hydrolase/OsmC family protein [Salinibacterium sp. M195]|uniref:bifunctional alpha/beta hydrolase/OsmC family protein n=1 Tax=Salinibacterium sp. M195 TaxID=2583374 RepID=UPI001C631FC7|nr:bifunctional alpha/beta hydrolase/OsmC family protein [Salinibacterium sp. M195]QYH36621.1 OsmC family protein [Salinibacterium sp. M195]